MGPPDQVEQGLGKELNRLPGQRPGGAFEHEGRPLGVRDRQDAVQSVGQRADVVADADLDVAGVNYTHAPEGLERFVEGALAAAVERASAEFEQGGDENRQLRYEVDERL